MIQTRTNTRRLLLPLAILAVTFAACNNDDDSTAQWRKDNQKAYNEIKASAAWSPVTLPEGAPTGVYYQDLSAGNTAKGSEYPLQTAAVTVNYTGMYYNGTVFDSGTGAVLTVNKTVRGFGVALQNMVVGDKWSICIPYHLGYGAYSTGSIPSYSTLFFDIELVDINQYP
ncbi:MAG: FKBP-type peptidyl-prolyl cis-trans isomerase [Dysgonamonadaceae bacterium]|jgi:FKBP-type peptidyl-prolyl cis-trans isomerase FklB|nr:FKBP-type peptidyl-prolyl cis-trans isomerase [Dysgonamonadaceae bacterium]